MTPKLATCTVSYEQENDSCDSGNLGQLIEFELQDAGGGPYYVIKTERWAFDSPEDLLKLLRDFVARSEQGTTSNATDR